MISLLKTGLNWFSHSCCLRTPWSRSRQPPRTIGSSGTSDSSLKPSSETDPRKSLDLTDDVLRDGWEEIIFHHTATPRSSKYDVEWCRSFHVNERGWTDIGYHFYIEHDGAISRGRPLSRIGAHCTGQNSRAIGIAVCGGIKPDGNVGITLTAQQTESMYVCVDALRERTGKKLPISGHNDHKATLCPLFDVDELFDE